MAEKRIKTSNVFLRNLESKTKITVNQGGTRCFSPQTKVVTANGLKYICDINENDMVLSHNFSSGEDEFRKCLSKFEMQNNKKTIKIKLKNGNEIIATEDHKFYVDGGWHSLKQILNDRRDMEANTKLYQI